MTALSAPDRIDSAVRLLRPDQVAEILGVTTRTVRRMAEEGRLTKIKLGRRSTRYRLAEVERLIEALTVPIDREIAEALGLTRGEREGAT